jgi:hypothetical protein
MVIKWFAKHGVPLNERGRLVADLIEYFVGFAIFLLVVGIAGGIEAGTIHLWGS